MRDEYEDTGVLDWYDYYHSIVGPNADDFFNAVGTGTLTGDILQNMKLQITTRLPLKAMNFRTVGRNKDVTVMSDSTLVFARGSIGARQDDYGSDATTDAFEEQVDEIGRQSLLGSSLSARGSLQARRGQSGHAGG